VGAPASGARPRAAAPTLAKTTIIEQPKPKARWTAILIIAAIALLVIAAFVWQRVQATRMASYGRFYAVVIGERNYRHFPELPTAVDDANAITDLLRNKYGYTVTPLRNATKAKILAALRDVARQMTANDNLLVFYAGHGSVDKFNKGYWQPVDADLQMENWIEPGTIRDVLIDQPSRRTLIIADSCYSGALASAQPTRSRDKRSRIVISSGGMEPVIDSADGQHSIFTRALLETLGDSRASVVDVQSVFAQVREKVVDAARRAGTEQKPQLAVLAEVGDEGGTYFFVRR
jgi:uncharacterized caspase-like protein